MIDLQYVCNIIQKHASYRGGHDSMARRSSWLPRKVSSQMPALGTTIVSPKSPEVYSASCEPKGFSSRIHSWSNKTRVWKLEVNRKKVCSSGAFVIISPRHQNAPLWREGVQHWPSSISIRHPRGDDDGAYRYVDGDSNEIVVVLVRNAATSCPFK
jgi:hypothetical protein